MTVLFPGAVMNNIELSPPSEMSASARAAEITTILAAAIVRTQLAQAATAQLQHVGEIATRRYVDQVRPA